MISGFLAKFLVLGVLGFGLSILFRKKIASQIKRIHLPKFALYLISSLPLIIFEENINCLPTGCVLFPSTIPILLFFVLCLGLIVKIFKIKRVSIATLIFSLFGLAFELAISPNLSAQYFAYPLLELIFGTYWVMVSYAFLAIIPLTVLIEK